MPFSALRARADRRRGAQFAGNAGKLLKESGGHGARFEVKPESSVRQVLDAPQLQDDFYLNLVDWSSQNVLAVGLGTCVYLWSACTSKV
jgi:hypothetical protein